MTPARARDFGIVPGILKPGKHNAITDVTGVKVGHMTLIEGDDIRTGATAIVPHSGNLFLERVPAGLFVANGFGKLVGSTQLVELGELETPVLLTNTLAVPRAAEALLNWTLNQSGNEHVRSINPVVGETNDGVLNNIRARALTTSQIAVAIANAKDGSVAEGGVGAGTGTVAFGWKAGIGTSSRVLPKTLGGYSLGVLVQANFGGVLQILGVPVGRRLGRYYLKDELDAGDADGSIMIVVATNAPLSDRNLTRVASRAGCGLARTGAAMTNGSGDYVIAFSTSEAVRRTSERRSRVAQLTELPNDLVSPLFQAVIEATEEAIYNALFMSETVKGFNGKTVESLPVEKVKELLRHYRVDER